MKLNMADTGKFTIHDLICSGNQDPERNAIESPGYLPLTYHALQMQILSVVRNLNARGFSRNDRIAILTPSGPETAVCIISVMSGFTAVPLNPQGREGEYRDLLQRSGIRALIVLRGYQTAATTVAGEMGIPVIELVPKSGTAGIFELVPPVSSGGGDTEFATASDTAFILFTSGTTAKSKIIPVSQKKSAITKLRTCKALGLSPADRSLHIVPYYHGMGLSAPLISPLYSGGTVICTKDFIPLDFFSLLREFRPTYYTAGPAIQRGIIRELKKIPPKDLKDNSLRFIRCGSGFLPEDVRMDLESLLGVPVIAAYSMSEIGTVSVNIPKRTNSVGIPMVSCLWIMDVGGNPLPPGQTGEIVIQDESVIEGYENAPEETGEVFTKNGFRTGDLGYLDEDGYLFITGRRKDLINKGGEKISPAEIDEVLLTHPGVREAMTFAVEDPALGEEIAALVVRDRDNLTEKDIRLFLIDRLSPSKLPRWIFFGDEIPKTPSGKPLRREGTQRYSGYVPEPES